MVHNGVTGVVTYECSSDQNCLNYDSTAMTNTRATYYQTAKLGHKVDNNRVCVPENSTYYLAAQPVIRAVLTDTGLS